MKGNGLRIPDDEGSELVSLDAAVLEATDIARELVARGLLQGETIDWTSAIEISTEAGFVANLSFLEAVDVPGQIIAG